MNKKSLKTLARALGGLLLVAFATIGVHTQESASAITGVPGSENLTGEIKWKKVVGLPPADAAGRAPLSNICEPFSIAVVDGGATVSGDNQLTPGRHDEEYYRCRYKVFAPRSRQITVKPAMTEDFYRNAWFGGLPLSPATSGEELNVFGAKIWLPGQRAQKRGFDQPYKFVTVGPVKGTWLAFELGFPAEMASRTRVFYTSDMKAPISWNLKRTPLDWCLDWENNCGKPAADAYCQARGYEQAKKFVKLDNVPETVTLRDKRVCNKSTRGVCDSFQEITCTRK